MRKQSMAVFIAVILALVLALSTAALAADPQDGTWKLNVAKSKFSPGPAPKSMTNKRETTNDSVRSIYDGVDAEGKAIHWEFTAKLDGKDYQATGNPDLDTVAIKRIDANTYDYVTKKGGKDLVHGQTVYSRDGKSRTQTEKGKNAKGQDVNNTLIYDRQ